MKKALALLLILTMAVGLAACGTTAPEQPAGAGDEPLRVALLLNGTLGDKSFFDSADRGL